MCWKQVCVRDARVEFVLRVHRGESLSALCREFEISRPTGYLWLKRFRDGGVAAIEDRSRRPHHSPGQTAQAVESAIVALRHARPDWGARKLAVLLGQQGHTIPAITVHRVLARHGLIAHETRRHPAPGRFERTRPNELWQMDFKGQKGASAAIGPLSVLDDHSRYLVALEQTGTTRLEAVRERLEGVFRAHGLPDAMLMDHGIPWWTGSAVRGWSQLSIWLMSQGIRCWFSGVRHPQTQGKVERFHGALERARARPDAGGWLDQAWLDAFRTEYNELRPHEALAMRTPASLWAPSVRAYDPNPPAWDYGVGAEVRRVNSCGHITINDTPWKVSVSLRKQYVQIERIEQRILVKYCNTLVREIDLAAHRSTAVER